MYVLIKGYWDLWEPYTLRKPNSEAKDIFGWNVAPHGGFRKLGIPYFGVLIIRILLRKLPHAAAVQVSCRGLVCGVRVYP